MKPLAGVRILDFSRAVAGAYGTLLLGDLGAEIIKIDQPPDEQQATAMDADWAALFGFQVSRVGLDTPEGMRRWRQGAGHFQSLNRNKKRLGLNMKSEAGKKVFYELVKKADIVYDNFRPSVLKRLGLDFETLKKYNPRIISCSISGYGGNGPWKEAPAYDVILQALGGGMSMTGLPGMPPCRAGLAIADLSGGAFAAMGMLAALAARDRTGEGQRVDMSMLDVQISLLNYRVGQYSTVGLIMGPVGSGHSGVGQIPYGAYECKEGTYICIAAGQPEFWGRFIRTLGLPELEHDPRFESNAARQKNVDEITGIIEGMLTTRTAQEWEKLFFEAGIPVGVVNNVAQSIEHPQVLARNMIVDVEQPSGETWKFAGNPIKMQGLEEKFEAAGDPGCDSEKVLSDILGYSKKSFEEMMKEKAVWRSEDGS